MHNSVTVSNLSLVFTFALVMVSVGISLKEQLGLTKDVLWSVCRAIVQLVIVGYVLKFIFNINNTWLTILMTPVHHRQRLLERLQARPEPPQPLLELPGGPVGWHLYRLGRVDFIGRH